jgi:hypothetical protein
MATRPTLLLEVVVAYAAPATTAGGAVMRRSGRADAFRRAKAMSIVLTFPSRLKS